MKLATFRYHGSTSAVRVDDDGTYTDLGRPDVGALLADDGWRAAAVRAAGPRLDPADGTLAPVVPRPGKIVCVGLNYRHHITEMGREIPTHPTLFAKYPEALVGPTDDIVAAPGSTAMDWEAELAVVIGRRVRSASPEEAKVAIAGFAAFNDVTMRDWQYRTTQWLQGKTFESTSPFGPVLVTPDELPGGHEPRVRITCAVNAVTMQDADTSDLVFGPIELVQYVSTIVTLAPGDVIATGTPGGVGHAHTPPIHLAPGDVVTTQVDGIGELRNRVVPAEHH
jgi:acylpyruvate hydrolase